MPITDINCRRQICRRSEWVGAMQFHWIRPTCARTSSGRRSRCLGVLGLSTLLVTLLAACGGPTAAQAAAKDLAAGIAAQNSGDYAAATTDYNKALAQVPTDADALYDLGDVEQFQHLYTAAESNYRAALAIDPNFIDAMYNLATLVTTSSPTEAEVLYEAVSYTHLNRDPHNRRNVRFPRDRLAVARSLRRQLPSRVPRRHRGGISPRGAGRVPSP